MWELRDAIIAKLKAVGGDPTKRLLEWKMGSEMIQVANDEVRGDWAGGVLILAINGRWAAKFGMHSYPVEENPTIDNLLSAYAIVKDEGLIDLMSRHQQQTGISPRSRRLSNSELERLYNTQEEEQLRYIENNKPKLLQGLIGNLERTLQNL